MITAIDHVALAVRDLDAAIDGYRRMLGREPNWKEEECLFHALGYMKRGNYKLADAELAQLSGLFAAAKNPGEPPESKRERYTAALLKRGLDQLRAGS